MRYDSPKIAVSLHGTSVISGAIQKKKKIKSSVGLSSDNRNTILSHGKEKSPKSKSRSHNLI